MRDRIAIERDFLGDATLLNGPRKETLGRRNIAVFAQQKVHGVSLLIHRTIKVAPLPSDLDIRLIDAPGSPDRPSILLPTLLKLRNIALHPAHNGGMRQIDAAFGHHRPQVSIAQFIGAVPSHAENYDLAVKVATSEQDRRGVREWSHEADLSLQRSSCTTTVLLVEPHDTTW
jgi:hypothetical protein